MTFVWYNVLRVFQGHWPSQEGQTPGLCAETRGLCTGGTEVTGGEAFREREGGGGASVSPTTMT